MRSEMITLIDKLSLAGIPFEVTKHWADDSPQVWYPKKGCGNVCDVICFTYGDGGSYGHERGLLEMMGLLTKEEEECDSVVGWLTANEVFARIFAHWIAQ